MLKKNKRDVIGFDLDGTIAENWVSNKYWHNFFLRFNESPIFRMLANWKIKRLKPVMIPIGWCYIITSRPPWTYKATRTWLIRNRINYFLLETATRYWHFQSDVRVKEKAESINNFSLTEYYEDEEYVRERLKKLCPDTKIMSPGEAVLRGRARKWES